jgi:hypothetical protein
MTRFNATAFRFAAAACFGAVLSSAAIASSNYKCDEPRTPIDRRACDAAAQGPEALRRFIERMRVIESLEFSDYMTDAQLLAWRDAKEPTRTVRANADGETKR